MQPIFLMELVGKNVVITGASSGIGRALAIVCAQKGANLFLCARREDALQETKKLCEVYQKNVFVYLLDICDGEAVQAFAHKLKTDSKPIHFLFNNAGISQRAYGFETDEKVEREIMEVNYFAQVRFTKALIPQMPEDSHIAVVSSVTGLMGFPLRTSYAASKHALKGYFESLQVEQSKYHITLAYPGRIKTDISRNALKQDGSTHNQLDQGQAEGMDAELCAKRIVRATLRKKHEILIGRKELLLVFFRRYIPFLYFKIAKKLKPL